MSNSPSIPHSPEVSDQIFSIQCRAMTTQLKRDLVRMGGAATQSAESKAAALELLYSLRAAADMVCVRAGISTGRSV